MTLFIRRIKLRLIKLGLFYTPEGGAYMQGALLRDIDAARYHELVLGDRNIFELLDELECKAPQAGMVAFGTTIPACKFISI
jgi:hypothetical protein